MSVDKKIERMFDDYVEGLPERAQQAVDSIKNLKSIINEFTEKVKAKGGKISLSAEDDGNYGISVTSKDSDEKDSGSRVYVGISPTDEAIYIRGVDFYNDNSTTYGNAPHCKQSSDQFAGTFKLDEVDKVAEVILQVAKDRIYYPAPE